MYDEFNEKDGENSMRTDRPSGGIYSGQRNDYNNRPDEVRNTAADNTANSSVENGTFSNANTVSTGTGNTESGFSQANNPHFNSAGGRNYESPYRTDSGRNESIYSSVNQAEAAPSKVKKEKKKSSNPFWKKAVAAVALGVIFGLTAGVTVYFVNTINGKTSVSQNQASVEDEDTQIKEVEPVKPDEKEEDKTEATNTKIESTNIVSSAATVSAIDVSEVVERVMPSVVSITGNYTVTSQDFFGQVYSQQSSGSGSGIIIGQNDENLLIATNNHVVEDSDSLSVQFIDGTTADARIKGTASDIDLAVILVDISDLSSSTKDSISVAVLGDSDSLKVGETAIAIGNALGYGQSVTTGVISAVDRKLEMSDGTVAEGLIQTDAAINPGNSGGALLNASGEVVGINSSKIGGTTVDGVGFAIPISSAEPILDDIVTSVERVKVANSKVGYLGIGGVTVTEEASKMYGIPVGVVVRKVYAGTGAEKAGIQQGDVITAINDKEIQSMEDLKEELQYYAAGETVEVKVCRINDGSYVTDTVTLELSEEKSLND